MKIMLVKAAWRGTALSGALSGALLLSTAFAPQMARAQWTPEGALMQNNSYYSGWVNPYDNTMTHIYQSNMNLITQQSMQNSLLFSSRYGSGGARRSGRVKSMSRTEKAAVDRFAKYRGTMYKDSGRPIAPAKLAAAFAKSTKADEKDLTKLFTVLLDAYKQRATAQGAPPNDVARTVAYSVAANYIYFNGKAGLDEGPIGVLRAKVRTALGEDAKFRALSNAQKQEMSETMVILAHLAALGVDGVAAKVPEEKRAEVKAGFRKLAGVNLKGLLGVEPSRVAFDKSGLFINAA